MIRSILSNWMALLITGAIGFVITPILIHGLGDVYYGMWILVASALDHYGLLDMGIRTTLQRFVAHQQGGGQRQALDETLATALAISVAVCGLACGLSVLLARVLPSFFGLGGTASGVFGQLVVVLGISVALSFPTNVLGAYLCGLQRFDLFNLAAVLTAGIRAALFVVVLHLGHGVFAVAGITLAMTVFLLVAQGGMVRWADPKLKLRWRNASAARARELFGFSVYVFLTSVGDYFRFRMDSIVIAKWLIMALVTPFNVIATLVNYLKYVSAALMGPLLPAMSALEAQSRHLDLRRLFLRATRGAWLLNLLLGALLLLNGKALLTVWVGKRFVSVYPLLVVLTAAYVVALGQSPSISLLFARGRHRALGLWTLGEGLANLALSIFWARKYGLMGVALGTAVSMIAVKLTIQPWYALRVAGVSARDYCVRALARPLAACSAFLGLVWLLTGHPATAGVAQLLLTVAWETCLCGILAYGIGLDKSDRQLFRERGKRLASTLRLAKAA